MVNTKEGKSVEVAMGFTVALSVWISFILPRQVVEPSLDLKQAVDRAASGDYQIEIQPQGSAEFVELARGVHNLIAHLTASLQRA